MPNTLELVVILLAVGVMVSVAGSEVRQLTGLHTVTLYFPAAVLRAPGMVSWALVAPEISAPLNFHWYVNGREPVAATLNVTLLPDRTVWSAGGVEMATGMGWTHLPAAPAL